VRGVVVRVVPVSVGGNGQHKREEKKRKKKKNRKQKEKETRFVVGEPTRPVSEARLHFDVLNVSWGGESGGKGKSVAMKGKRGNDLKNFDARKSQPWELT
jgi:hypothetical protein